MLLQRLAVLADRSPVKGPRRYTWKQIDDAIKLAIGAAIVFAWLTFSGWSKWHVYQECRGENHSHAYCFTLVGR
jgi:hypothetical protein